MSAVEFWRGKFGDDYQERNAGEDMDARKQLWRGILAKCPGAKTILEIGAGNGNNLEALHRLGYPLQDLVGVDPNANARSMLREAGFGAYDGTAEYPGQTADLTFTSGVLIHIPPSFLLPACRGIHDASNRYIVCVEYFSADPEEKKYRGHTGKLWKRDFGGYWLDHFNVEPLGCGFAWKRTTGLDDLTWWAFRKC